MTKKSCKIKLSIIAVLTIVGLVLTFVSFVVPFTNTTYNGFFNAINYGYDVSGGKLAVYTVNDESLTEYEKSKKLENTATKLNSYFEALGFNVSKQGNDIRIEVSSTDYVKLEELYRTYNIDILSLLGSESGITFSSDSSTYNKDGYVDGSHIVNCSYSYVNGYWGVKIEFDEEGKSLFRSLTGSNTTIYMFVNSETSGQSIESTYWGGGEASSITLYYDNQQVAQAINYEIAALAKPVKLTQVSNNVITAGLNTSVKSVLGNQTTLLLIALVVLFVASLVFLSIRYKMFGVLSIMASLIFVVVYSFLLQSIPLVLMDFNGVLGVLFTYVALIIGMVEIFEKIRSEYAVGKKIPNSVRSGFKKNVLPTLEKYVFGIIFFAIFYIVGSVGLKTFAVCAFVGLFVNYFILFAILRGIVALYIPINSTNKKAYNLKREAVKDEI